ncbi:MAG TPA: sigma-70 family RNA polymerase sigma factor [Urbifossiella sp.]|nr:sigma-70 family RNA polymerase sigma factor [Urbifossiella sp.]
MSTRSVPFAVITDHLRLAPVPDADLLRQFTDTRDEGAFAEIVRRYGRTVWRVARAGTRHAATAEDVFQATFLALARHAPTVRRPDALAGWLHRTAVRASTRARRSDVRAGQPGGRPADAIGEEPGPTTDPLDRLTARELLAAVDDEIQTLPAPLRAAVVLCGVEGLSHEAAAARLGWSAGSVKGRLERARATLRQRLTARGLTVPAGLFGLVGAVADVTAVPSELLRAAQAVPRTGPTSPAVAALAVRATARPLRWLVLPVIVAAAVSAGVVAADPAADPGPLAASAEPQLASPANPAPPAPPEAKRPAPPVRGFEQLADLGGRAVGRGGDKDAVTTQTYSVVFNPASTLVAAGYEDKLVRVWDVATRRCVATLQGHKQLVRTVAFSPDGKFLASGSADETVRVWDAKTWAEITVLKGEVGQNRSFHGIYSVAFSPDGKSLAVGCGLHDVRFWEVGTWKKTTEFQSEYQTGVVAFSPDGKTLVRGGGFRNSTVEFVEAATGRVIAQEGALTSFGGMAFRPDGKVLAVTWNRRIDFLDPTTARRVADPIKGVQNTGVAFSPDGKLVAANTEDDTLKVWNVETREIVAGFPGCWITGLSVRFSPDGKMLAAGLGDRVVNGPLLGTIRLWATPPGQAKTP